MPRNSIGDFYVTIAAEVDKNSFETSNKLVDDVGNSFNKLTGSARNAANVLGNITLQQTQVGGASYDLSTKLDVASEALDLWRATARLTTGDANALDNALAKLSDVKLHLHYDGRGLRELQTQLDKISLSYSKLENLSADEQMEYILEHARKLVTDKGEDKATIAAYVKDILGPGAQQTFLKIIESGMTVPKYMETEAKPKILTTAEDNKVSAEFQKELRELQLEIDATKKLLGADIAKLLTPQLKRLNDWYDAHGEEIKTAMEALAGALANATEKLFGGGKAVLDAGGAIKAINEYRKSKPGTPERAAAIGKLREYEKAFANNPATKWLSDFVDSIYEKSTRDKILGEDINAIYGWYKEANKGKKKKDQTPLKYSDLNEGQKGVVDEYINMGGQGHKDFIEMNDGIIRPDGTVTKLAPDDWVFAARNIGDMARAFIPQSNNTLSAPSEYSIVQNFTINGGNDMPQVLRQEAYRGTQEGLLEMMDAASRRLQLMSGTR